MLRSSDAPHAPAAPRGETGWLLFVEDDRPLAEPIVRGLKEEGYAVDHETDGRAGLTQALTGDYDVLVIDWRLPTLDGRQITERVRAAGLGVPILMLTAMRDVDYRVAGLDAGADDYLTKPFSFEELLARLRALRRRGAGDASGEAAGLQAVHLRAGALTLDAARREARLAGARLDLYPKELRLLEVLMRRQGEVVTRTVLAERVWGSALDVTDNAIGVAVSGLRRKISETADLAGHSPTVRIDTVRGTGYLLTTGNADSATS